MKIKTTLEISSPVGMTEINSNNFNLTANVRDAFYFTFLGYKLVKPLWTPVKRIFK